MGEQITKTCDVLHSRFSIAVARFRITKPPLTANTTLVTFKQKYEKNWGHYATSYPSNARQSCSSSKYTAVLLFGDHKCKIQNVSEQKRILVLKINVHNRKVTKLGFSTVIDFTLSMENIVMHITQTFKSNKISLCQNDYVFLVIKK